MNYYKKYTPYLFILPAAAVLIVFFFIPFFQTFGLSFFDYSSSLYNPSFNGLDNYIKLFKEPIFYQMCEEMLLQEAYLQLPLMWEEGDGLEVALSIAKYVYQSWDRMDEFDLLCEKEDVKGIKLLDLMVETIEFE